LALRVPADVGTGQKASSTHGVDLLVVANLGWRSVCRPMSAPARRRHPRMAWIYW